MTDTENKYRKEYIARVNRAMDYIRENINNELTLIEIADVAGFSRFYFHRIFKSIVGATLNTFVKNVRIQKASFMLTHQPEVTISNIGYECGFTSPTVFSRTFKECIGYTPTEWRKDKNSKNRIINNNLSIEVDKARQDDKKFSMYFDATNKPKWSIKMLNEKELVVDVVEMPDQIVAYVRHHGKYDPQDKDLFKSMFDKLLGWAIPRNLFVPPETKAIMSYSNGNPKDMTNDYVSVDVCITIESHNLVDGDISSRVIPSGKYAELSLFGVTMEESAVSWDYVFHNWLPNSGFQPGDGDYYVHHLNDPEQHPEKLYDLKMYLPVKPL